MKICSSNFSASHLKPKFWNAHFFTVNNMVLSRFSKNQFAPHFVELYLVMQLSSHAGSVGNSSVWMNAYQWDNWTSLHLSHWAYKGVREIPPPLGLKYEQQHRIAVWSFMYTTYFYLFLIILGKLLIYLPTIYSSRFRSFFTCFQQILLFDVLVLHTPCSKGKWKREDNS